MQGLEIRKRLFVAFEKVLIHGSLNFQRKIQLVGSFQVHFGPSPPRPVLSFRNLGLEFMTSCPLSIIVIIIVIHHDHHTHHLPLNLHSPPPIPFSFALQLLFLIPGNYYNNDGNHVSRHTSPKQLRTSS